MDPEGFQFRHRDTLGGDGFGGGHDYGTLEDGSGGGSGYNLKLCWSRVDGDAWG